MQGWSSSQLCNALHKWNQFEVIYACLYPLDGQSHGDAPRWQGVSAGTGLHSGQQNPLPHSAGHVEERAHVEKYEEQEPGRWSWQRESCHPQSTRWGNLFAWHSLHRSACTSGDCHSKEVVFVKVVEYKGGFECFVLYVSCWWVVLYQCTVAAKDVH